MTEFLFAVNWISLFKVYIYNNKIKKYFRTVYFMTEEIFSLILLIYYEICIILLQHQGKTSFKIILAFN